MKNIIYIFFLGMMFSCKIYNSQSDIYIELIKEIIDEDYFYESKDDFIDRIKIDDSNYSFIDSLYNSKKEIDANIYITIIPNYLKLDSIDYLILSNLTDESFHGYRNQKIIIDSKKLKEEVKYLRLLDRDNFKKAEELITLSLSQLYYSYNMDEVIVKFNLTCTYICCKEGYMFLKKDKEWNVERIKIIKSC